MSLLASMHVGFDFQTLSLLVYGGSILIGLGVLLWSIWTLDTSILCIYITSMYLCTQWTPPASLTTRVQRWAKMHSAGVHHVTDNPSLVEQDATKTSRPEIVLCFPHGLICIEAGMVALSSSTPCMSSYVVMTDTLLRYMSPLSVLWLRLLGYKDVVALSHKNITFEMSYRRNSLIVMPGGFVEAVGGTHDVQYLNLHTVSYWLKQARKYDYAVRLYYVHNGSSMVLQSGWYVRYRMHVAQRYKLPLILPYRVQRVEQLRVSMEYYETAPDASETIQKKLTHMCTSAGSRSDHTKGTEHVPIPDPPVQFVHV